MLRVKDLDASIRFYCDHLGMKELRRQDYPSGEFTLAFVGYGDESEHTVLEFTYNYGKSDYELGDAFGHVAIGVDDIACLIDFGVPNEVMLDSLPLLDRVRREANEAPAGVVEVASQPAAEIDCSLPALVDRHGVTHMQCTPSHARMLLTDPDTRDALGRIEHWMIGGEAFPVSLAGELQDAGCRNVTNMYGPTETTIWSSTERIEGRPSSISKQGRPPA